MLDSQSTGIHFTNEIQENAQNFIDVFNYAYNGGGVAIGDINNDNLPDIYFTGNQVADKLYLNKGHLEFEDISKKSGINKSQGWRNGVSMVDINHDGYLDIYICRGGWNDAPKDRKNLLFINNGNLGFTEQASKYGLDDDGYSTQAAFFDFDNDNDLDLYLTNRPSSFFIPIDAYLNQKELSRDVHRDKLYINANGNFTEIGKQAGLKSNYGYGLGVVTADINKDGYTDIYVTNDFAENDYLYLNNGDGTVTESIKKFTQHNSFYAMGVDIADINNDGYEDVLVSEMLPSDYKRSKTTMAPMNRAGYQYLLDKGFHRQYMHNTLQLNHQGKHLSDIAEYATLDKTDWSWACLMEDFDNDGYRDVFVANGIKRDVYDRDVKPKMIQLVNANKKKYKTQQELTNAIAKDIINLYGSNKLPNRIFKNTNGLKFKSVNEPWGIEKPSLSNGAATADLDNDGDLDLVINNIDDEAHVYRNNQNNTNKFIQISLNGPKKNKTGLGAKISLFIGDALQFFEMKTTRGFLSSVEPLAHFGLGDIQRVDSLKVQWTDGKVTTLRDIKANQRITIAYSDAIESITKEKEIKTIFEDQTAQRFKKPFIHIENEFDDYTIQPLLPHKLSHKGPFISIGDVNNDKLDDFFVGGPKGQPGTVYIQNIKGEFIPVYSKALFKDKEYEDMGSAFFDADNDGDVDLYIVSGGYEFEMRKELYQDRLYINDGKGGFSKGTLPRMDFVGSCVTPLDYDQDGDKDLFVGGHAIPGAYPFSENSALLENTNGSFENVFFPKATDFKELGLVNTALVIDIENDGAEELVVAGEWAPIHVFSYDGTEMRNVSNKYIPEKTNGWWNTLVSTDIDNDGDIDIIAGNLGENYKYKASQEKPFHIYAGDYDRNNTIDIFLAKYDKNRQVPVRGKDCATEQLPSISKRFKTYAEFANADIFQVINAPFNSTRKHLEAYMFNSVLFLNKNGEFMAQTLPAEAQLSTLNGIAVYDFDADGYMDVIGGGNNFDVEIETTRADASIGFLLQHKKRDTLPHFEFYPSSGISLPYNIKDIKPIKLGTQEAFGFLASSNNDTLRLFSAHKLK
ncbi:VCBS repeat-containing protein [Flavivirga spongiicola]|uniref:VCBS repeat-containing protein n=1 Tax=Flavivirga spongiicola TaxID=421621 RepID=A0ABU7XVN0_9FLAO|nr:VCBS repeat-containing protein [Flavivirga sp. MEBiC05379]MDO5979840.1 VCBS repeat-containing protein [Flavivirga sp. MEBiC05379]